MTRVLSGLAVSATFMCAVWMPTPVAAQQSVELSSPLTLADVIRLATDRRDEIGAARARVLPARHAQRSCLAWQPVVQLPRCTTGW